LIYKYYSQLTFFVSYEFLETPKVFSICIFIKDGKYYKDGVLSINVSIEIVEVYELNLISFLNTFFFSRFKIFLSTI